MLPGRFHATTAEYQNVLLTPSCLFRSTGKVSNNTSLSYIIPAPPPPSERRRVYLHSQAMVFISVSPRVGVICMRAGGAHLERDIMLPASPFLHGSFTCYHPNHLACQQPSPYLIQKYRLRVCSFHIIHHFFSFLCC